MPIEKINLSWSLFKIILTETFRGKSLERILMNYSLSKIKLAGLVLDLGAGPGSASYHRFLKQEPGTEIIATDFYKGGAGVLKLDLEKPFPIEGDKFDYVMCFNVLEHIYNYKNVIEESYRILKKGGLFIGSTPFLLNYHPDPNDYFRYTHQALFEMFKETGLMPQKMIYLGFGPLIAGLCQWISLCPRIFRPGLIFSDILLDVLISKLSKNYQLKHPLGYVYVFKK